MDDKDIRNYVEQRIARWADFTMHLVGYIIGNGIIWLLWALSNSGFSFIWPLLISLFWLIGLAIHGVEVFYKTVVLERAYQHELNRVHGYIKPKRNGLVSFNDDGELHLPDDEISYRQTAKHN